MRGSFFAVGAKNILGLFRRRRNCFWTCCVADEFCFGVFFAAGEKMFGFFFVLISSQMLCLGLVSSFSIEYFTSFDNSIETVAVFLRCLRKFLANQARDTVACGAYSSTSHLLTICLMLFNRNFVLVSSQNAEHSKAAGTTYTTG